MMNTLSGLAPRALYIDSNERELSFARTLLNTVCILLLPVEKWGGETFLMWTFSGNLMSFESVT